MIKTKLDRALAEAKQYVRATDDPRNYDAELAILKLLIAYVEERR